tara:strand:+ start:668 stop:772 length:105 start_codon:yes stop_codon:yes gene_type:complete
VIGKADAVTAIDVPGAGELLLIGVAGAGEGKPVA